MGEGNDVTDNSLQPKASFTWLLLDLGGRRGNIDQQIQQLVGANHQFNKAIQDLLLNVQASFYGWHAATAALHAAEVDLENTQKSLDAAQQRLENGIGTQLDVLQAQSVNLDAMAQLESAKGALHTAEGTLAQAIGLPADTRLLVAPMPGLPASNITATAVLKVIHRDLKESAGLANMSKKSISALIDAALARRSDIAYARTQVKAKAAALQTANSALWPTLNAGGSVDQIRHNYSGNDQPLQESAQTYMAYLAVQWNFFDGFHNLQAKRAAAEALAAEEAALASAEIDASGSVWSKYYALDTAMKKLEYNQAFLDSAQASYNLALEGYEAGLKSILDLLQAQSKLAQARSDLISAMQRVFNAYAEFIYAMGLMGQEPVDATR